MEFQTRFILCSAFFFVGTEIQIVLSHPHNHHHQVSWTRVAMCRAHCVKSLLNSTVPGIPCLQSAICTNCWQTCERLVIRPRDRHYICRTNEMPLLCLQGCHKACDVIKRHSPVKTVSEEYGEWELSLKVNVEMTTSRTITVSWSSATRQTGGNNRINEDDDVTRSDVKQSPLIIYVLMQKLSRHAFWEHVYSTTDTSATLEVNHQTEQDIYYKILAVNKNGQLANMDFTVANSDLEMLRFGEKEGEPSTSIEIVDGMGLVKEERYVYTLALYHTTTPWVTTDSPRPSDKHVRPESSMSSLEYHFALAACIVPPTILCNLAIILYSMKKSQIRKSYCGDRLCRSRQQERQVPGQNIFNTRDRLLRRQLELQMSIGDGHDASGLRAPDRKATYILPVYRPCNVPISTQSRIPYTKLDAINTYTIDDNL